MQKSQAVQVLLTTVFGPVGLLYSSTSIALLLMLATLCAVLLYEEQVVPIVACAVALSIVSGIVRVHLHNRYARRRDYTTSTFIGRVNCRSAGKRVIKRNYHKSLARVRLLRQLRYVSECTLALACGGTCLAIAAPELKSVWGRQLQTHSDGAENNTPTPVSDQHPTWKLTTDSAKHISAQLPATEYQHSSEGWYRPVIEMVCDNNRSSLHLHTRETLATERVKLRVSADQQPPTVDYWKISDDYRSASAERPVATISRLDRADQLAIEYTTFGTDTMKKAVFDTRDSDDAVGEIRRACNW